MRIRPIGITTLAVLSFVNVALYIVLAALAVLDHSALIAVLHVLSPSGTGPEAIHTAMGRLLPLYYAAMAVVTTALAMGFWRLWNWTRIVVLAMIAISLAVMGAEVPLLLKTPTTGAVLLTLVRVALCVLVGGYLLSRAVREAFRQAHKNASVASALRA